MRKVILFAKKFLKALKVFISRVLADGGIIEAKNYVNSLLKTVTDASLVLIPSAYKSGVLYSILPEDGTGDFTASRNSVATRINPIGLIEEVGINVPRIDYTDGTPVLLTEPQSTNLITYSSDFSDASWSKLESTVSSNTIASPDGIVNADTIIPSVTNIGDHKVEYSFTPIISTFHTITCYVKKAGYESITMNSGATRLYATFNLTSLTITGLTSNGTDVNQESASITDIGSGWLRLQLTGYWITINANYVRIIVNENEGTYSSDGESYAGDGTSGIYIWGAQVEQLPYATSYIPTEGATATRLGELVTDAGDVNTFNSEEGVLFVEMAALSDLGVSRLLSLNDGSSNNRITIEYRDELNAVLFQVHKSGLRILNRVAYFDKTLNNKIAFKYKNSNYAVWVNGVELISDILADNLPLNTLNTVSFNGGTDFPFYGKTKQIQVFKTALTDLELTELTTL